MGVGYIIWGRVQVWFHSFSIIHDRYGIQSFPRFPYVVREKEGRTLWEFPLTTFAIFNFRIPISGGGYIRIMPYSTLKSFLRCINFREKNPFIIYFHPWELDPHHPLPKNIPKILILRHTIGINTTKSKLRAVLRDFKFSTIREVLNINFHAGI